MEYKKVVKEKKPAVKKTKTCSGCNKEFPAMYKTLTVDGKKQSFCQACAPKVIKKVEKEKILKVKARKKARKSVERDRKNVSMTNLKTLVQKFSRLFGDPTCCSCNRNFAEHGLQVHGGHFCLRGKASTSLLITNISAQCASCNFAAGEQYLHSKYLDSFWGKGTADKMVQMSKVTYTFSLGERKEIFDKVSELLSLSHEDMTLAEKRDVRRMFQQWQSEQEWFQIINSQII